MPDYNDPKHLASLMAEFHKCTGYAYGGKVKGYDDGGTVKSPVESAQESMRKAFHFSDGGTVEVQSPTQSAQDSMRKAFHFADGTPEVPEEAPETIEDPDTVVRANPNSDAAIDKLAQDEFSDREIKDQSADELPEELDRSKEPAPLDKVSKDEEKQSPEEKAADEKKFEEEFAAKEKEAEEADRKPAAEDAEPEEDKAEEVKQAAQEAPEPEVTPISPMGKGAIDYGQGSALTQKALAAAQQERRDEIRRQQLLKYGNLLGAGIAKSQPLPQDFFENKAAINAPVQEFEEKLATEKHDPNSAVSKAMKQFVTQKYGLPIKGNPSAADLELISKPLYNEAAAELKGRYTLLKEQQHAANVAKQIGQRGGEARKTVETRGEIQKDIAGKKAAEKKNENEVKGISKVNDKIEQSKSRGVVKTAYDMERRVNNIQSMIDEYPDLNSMPRAQAKLLYNELAFVAKGGVPGAGEVKEYMPETIIGRFKNAYSNLANEPTGQELGSFIKENIPYLQSLKQNSQRVVGENVINNIENNKKSLAPDDYEALMNKIEYKPYIAAARSAQTKENPSGKGGKAPASEGKSGSNEVKRMTKDGKVAIFDSKTKKFLRYE